MSGVVTRGRMQQGRHAIRGRSRRPNPACWHSHPCCCRNVGTAAALKGLCGRTRAGLGLDGAVGQQTAPAETVGAGEHDRGMQQAEADGALKVCHHILCIPLLLHTLRDRHPIPHQLVFTGVCCALDLFTLDLQVSVMHQAGISDAPLTASP